MNEEDRRPEIIIVRRSADGEEGHHGGAWKIAFADFMTAMMALFLVLWLVNAANEKTKKSVASYFNPVKLIDRQRSSRGLDDNTDQDGSAANTAKSNSNQNIPGEKYEGSQRPVKDEQFFEDPFAVMDGLVKVEQAKIDQSETSLVREYLERVPSEDAFHDPFAQADASPPVAENHHKKEGEIASSKPAPILSESEEPLRKLELYLQSENFEKKEVLPALEKQAVRELILKKQKVENFSKDTSPKKSEVMSKEERSKKLEEMAGEILSEIKGKLVEKFGDQEKMSNSLSVQTTSEGILISITDQLDFSMFQVGSAVPKGAIILAMAEISSVLKVRQGKVRIYGHTDARPYSRKGYDNWRLSTARSHAARLMLIRGLLDEKRISQVVGFADTRLLIPQAPQADANRRVEILLEVL